jgi:hypothetical protein
MPEPRRRDRRRPGRRGRGAAREAEVLGGAAACAFGQQQRRHGREHAERDLGLAELRVGSGDQAVAERGQLEAAAQAVTAHGRHHGHRGRGDRAEQAVEALKHRRDAVGQVLVHAGAEREVRSVGAQ